MLVQPQRPAQGGILRYFCLVPCASALNRRRRYANLFFLKKRTEGGGDETRKSVATRYSRPKSQSQAPRHPPAPSRGAPPPPSLSGRRRRLKLVADEGVLTSRTENFVSQCDELLSDLLTLVRSFDHTRDTSEWCGEVSSAQQRAQEIVTKFLEPEQIVVSRSAHRIKVLDELLQTERDYCSSLETLRDVWAPEVARSNALTADQMALLFGSVQQILTLSRELESEISREVAKPEGEQRVGETFLRKVPFVRLYVEYCCNQVEAAPALRAKETQAKLAAVMAKVKAGVRGLDLESFLIKPTQRLTKWPLLLRDLAADTPESHPDHPALVKCLKDLQAVIGEVNTRASVRETVLFLNSRMLPSIVWSQGSQSPVDLVASQSRLLIEGTVPAVVSKVPVAGSTSKTGDLVVLFDNLLVVCSVVGDKWHEVASLPVVELAVKGSPSQRTIILERKAQGPERQEVALAFSDENQCSRWVEATTGALAAAPSVHAVVRVLQAPSSPAPQPPLVPHEGTKKAEEGSWKPSRPSSPPFRLQSSGGSNSPRTSSPDDPSWKPAHGTRLRVELPHENRERWNRVVSVLKDEKLTTSNGSQMDSFMSALSGKTTGHFFMLATREQEYATFDWQSFFRSVPHLRRLASDLPEIFRDTQLFILLGDTDSSVTLTRLQVACLLLLGFLGVFEPQERTDVRINTFCLSSLLRANQAGAMCLVNYLRHVGSRIASNPHDSPYRGEWFGAPVVFSRNTVKGKLSFSDCREPTCSLRIVTGSSGRSSRSQTPLQASFVNSLLGGTVLTRECAEEEVIYLERPEAMLGLACVQVMSPRDSIVITGSETHSVTSGFGRCFRFCGDPPGTTHDTARVAIVFLDVSVPAECDQFAAPSIHRDLTKAFVGMQAAKGSEIATENWSAAGLHGDPQLKLFVQWIAASAAGVKQLVYYVGKERPLANLADKTESIRAAFPTVASMHKALLANKLEKNEAVPMMTEAAASAAPKHKKR